MGRNNMVLTILEGLRKAFPWWVRHYHRLEVRGVENLPKVGSAIIAPNHSGGWDLDNFTLMSALEQFKANNPARKRIWLMYWDVWSVENPIWAPWVQKFSPVPISLRGKGIPYRMVDKLVKRGELLAIMPEGHSAALYEGYRLWKFYPGVILLHLRYKIPIIPTAMIGFVKAAPILGHQYNPNNVPPWEKEIIFPLMLPRKCIVHFGPPIEFTKYFNNDIDKATMYKLASIVRQKVRDVISTYVQEVSWKRPYGTKTRTK